MVINKTKSTRKQDQFGQSDLPRTEKDFEDFLDILNFQNEKLEILKKNLLRELIEHEKLIECENTYNRTQNFIYVGFFAFISFLIVYKVLSFLNLDQDNKVYLYGLISLSVFFILYSGINYLSGLFKKKKEDELVSLLSKQIREKEKELYSRIDKKLIESIENNLNVRSTESNS